ncbi:hypothetical protein F7725_023352 [Dissostichus mawsoni]|uniref:Uncharacterized protein n=1 Tax=Dissostichus mawsoni TaxID=36200 RepID=A0A7J5Z3C1_DISMA|nr:hypothetical protein F7725_023352 [Dissostichus mawsoni]
MWSTGCSPVSAGALTLKARSQQRLRAAIPTHHIPGVPHHAGPVLQRRHGRGVRPRSCAGGSQETGFFFGGKRGNNRRNPPAPGAAVPGKGAPKDCNDTGEEEEERKERERIQKEEEERKTKVQIYVFVLRCIAYPFNAKQPTDMARRQQKGSLDLRVLTQ